MSIPSGALALTGIVLHGATAALPGQGDGLARLVAQPDRFGNALAGRIRCR